VAVEDAVWLPDTVFANTSFFAAAGLTVMPLWVPVTDGVMVSVEVMVRVPAAAVFRVYPLAATDCALRNALHYRFRSWPLATGRASRRLDGRAAWSDATA